MKQEKVNFSFSSNQEVECFFDKFDSKEIYDLSKVKRSVKNFFKELKNAKSFICEIEDNLDSNNSDTEYLVCAFKFEDGWSKDHYFKLVSKGKVRKVF